MMELSGQLLCSLPHGHILENIEGGSLTDRGALAELIRIEGGWFTPPDRPGQGLVFDRALAPTRSPPEPSRDFLEPTPKVSRSGAFWR